MTLQWHQANPIARYAVDYSKFVAYKKCFISCDTENAQLPVLQKMRNCLKYENASLFRKKKMRLISCNKDKVRRNTIHTSL